jgi:hypothetical protein
MATLQNVGRTNRFAVSIVNLPNIAKQAQTIDIESMTVNDALAANSFIDMPIPGEKIQPSSVDVSFVIDENYVSYIEGYNYLQSVVYDNSAIVKTEEEFPYFDITVSLYNSEYTAFKNNLIFETAWLSSLGPVSLDVTGADPIICVATFQYLKLSVQVL